jgi:hypothetical protein
MSADGNAPKAVPPLPIPLLRSNRACALCQLPIGESQFSIGLMSGGSLHLDCYLSLHQHEDWSAN